jgi:hypothetical protein
MLTAILSMLLAGAPAGSDVKIDRGRGNFESLPQVALERPLPTPEMVERVQKILATGTCRLTGQTPRVFDITIPYAIELRPDGTTGHVIVGDRGCPEIETLVGRAVVQLSVMGDFRRKATTTTRWVASEMNFNLK